MKVIYSDSSEVTVRGPSLADANFSIESNVVNSLISAGSTSSGTVDDRNIVTHTTATYDSGHDITIAEAVPGTIDAYSEFVSLDTDIATVNSTGSVRRVSDGVARIQYRTRLLNKQMNLSVARFVGASVVVQNGYTNGTLAKHCTDAIDTRIVGLTPSVVKPLFSVLDHSTPSYTRNTNCWASNINLTCIAAWNSYYVTKFGPTAITPRHVAFNNHNTALIPNGTTIRFVTAGNVVVTRTLTSSVRISDSDLQIGKLDSDLPATIVPCRAFPSNALDYLPSISNHYEIPVIVINQEKKALIYDWDIIGAYSYGSIPDDSTRLGFYTSLISGDSCSPAFAVVNNELTIVLTATTGYGSISGPNFISWHDAINSALTSLGGGYQLDTLDLTGFTDFS